MKGISVSQESFIDPTELENKILGGGRMDYSDLEVCNAIMEASLGWSKEHLKENPPLKKAMDLATYNLVQSERYGSEEDLV